MSTKAVKGTEVDGDVVVGRHTTVGGDAKVRGDLTVDGDLIVGGRAVIPNASGGTGSGNTSAGDCECGSTVLFFDVFDTENMLNANTGTTASVRAEVAPLGAEIVWCSRDNRFYGRFGGEFYYAFTGHEQYGDLNGKGITCKPDVLYVHRAGDVYIRCALVNSAGATYHTLVAVNSELIRKLALRWFAYDASTRKLSGKNAAGDTLSEATLPLATTDSDGLMSKEKCAELSRLSGGRPIFPFARVIYNEDLEADELACKDGDIVLFLDQNMQPDKVKVAIGPSSYIKFYELPTAGDDDSALFFMYCSAERFKLQSDGTYILRPGALFVGRDDRYGVSGLYLIDSEGAPQPFVLESGLARFEVGLQELEMLEENMPEPQTDSEGDESQYVYSVADAEDARCVMTMRDTTIIQQDGQLMFQRGFWSAASESGKYQATRIPLATPSADGAMSKTDKQQLNASIATIGGHLVVGGVMNLGHFSSLDGALTEAARSEVSGARDVAVIRFTYAGMAGTVASFIFQTIKGDDISIQYIFDRGTVTVRSVTGATGGNSGVNPVNVETTWVHRLRWNGNSIEAIGYEPYGGTAPVLASLSGVAKTSQLPTEATSTKSGLMTAAQFNQLSKLAEKVASLEQRVTAIELEKTPIEPEEGADN